MQPADSLPKSWSLVGSNQTNQCHSHRPEEHSQKRCRSQDMNDSAVELPPKLPKLESNVSLTGQQQYQKDRNDVINSSPMNSEHDKAASKVCEKCIWYHKIIRLYLGGC